MSTQRSAFTMVEMLVVILIVAILAGLLVALIPQAIFMAKRAATAQRMDNILTAIQLYGQSTGQSPAMIMRYGMQTPKLDANGNPDPVLSMPDDLQWQPLGSVIRSVWGGKSSAPMAANRKLLFPNVAFTQTVTVPSYAFRPSDWTWWMDAGAPPAVANKIASLRTFDSSELGDSFDTTQEIAPFGITDPRVGWFRARWPRVWPASDWDQIAPGRIPVRWESPWGRPAYDPQTLAPTPPAQRSLDQLSPLDAIRLLQLAGVLPAGPQGEDAYRNNRKPDKPWNDRWGNPLVVVSAAFVAPRAEACDNRVLAWTGRSTGTIQRLVLLGAATTSFGESSPWPYVGGSPRDALLSRYTQDLGFNRAVYLAVGAVGPELSEPLPTPWTANEDAATLRALWLQVRDVCRASEWDEQAFASQPWKGARAVTRGRQRSMLSSPIEVK